MKFMAEIRCKNIKNTDLILLIQNAINNENLDEKKNIKKRIRQRTTKQRRTIQKTYKINYMIINLKPKKIL